jgi:hypothetical protein
MYSYRLWICASFIEVKFINLSTKGGSFSMVLDPTLNGENMRFWLTFFIGFVFAHFLSIWHEEDIIQQLKAWSFRMWKNLVHTQSNPDTIARWSSITFFLYILYTFIYTIHYINVIIRHLSHNPIPYANM